MRRPTREIMRRSLAGLVGLALGATAGSAAALWNASQTTTAIESGFASARTWIAVGTGQDETTRTHYSASAYPLEADVSASSTLVTSPVGTTLPGIADFLSGNAPTAAITFTVHQANRGKFSQSARLTLKVPAALATFKGSLSAGACTTTTPPAPTGSLWDLQTDPFATRIFATTVTTAVQEQTTSYCLVLGRPAGSTIAYTNTATLEGLGTQPMEVSSDSTTTWSGTIGPEQPVLSNLDGLAVEAVIFWAGP